MVRPDPLCQSCPALLVVAHGDVCLSWCLYKTALRVWRTAAAYELHCYWSAGCHGTQYPNMIGRKPPVSSLDMRSLKLCVKNINTCLTVRSLDPPNHPTPQSSQSGEIRRFFSQLDWTGLDWRYLWLSAGPGPALSHFYISGSGGENLLCSHSVLRLPHFSLE